MFKAVALILTAYAGLLNLIWLGVKYAIRLDPDESCMPNVLPIFTYNRVSFPEGVSLDGTDSIICFIAFDNGLLASEVLST